MKINSLKKLKSLKGKRVFLRVDFNVPLKNGKIREDYKIKAGLETIEFLLAREARLIIATHLGEPSSKYEAKYSVKPVATRLKTILRRPVKFLADPSTSPKIKSAVKALKPKEILFLENLRFNKGEYADDDKFAKSLASLADIYVNDAFAVSHRAQASVSKIKKYLPSYAGLLLEKELNACARIFKPKKPLIIVMGGAKIETKAPLLAKLLPAASRILIGGALANNFFKFQNLEIGRSFFDAGSEKVIKKFYRGNKINAKIILPLDLVVKTKNGEARVVDPKNVKPTDCIFDIGPKAITDFAAYIKTAQTIVWNGRLGKFEENSFKYGTMSIAGLIAARSSGRAYGLIGGGETVEAIKLTGMSEYVDWISTAGGAMLTYLGGGKMPGLKGIVKD